FRVVVAGAVQAGRRRVVRVQVAEEDRVRVDRRQQTPGYVELTAGANAVVRRRIDDAELGPDADLVEVRLDELRLLVDVDRRLVQDDAVEASSLHVRLRPGLVVFVAR